MAGKSRRVFMAWYYGCTVSILARYIRTVQVLLRRTVYPVILASRSESKVLVRHSQLIQHTEYDDQNSQPPGILPPGILQHQNYSKQFNNPNVRRKYSTSVFVRYCTVPTLTATQVQRETRACHVSDAVVR
jgi:hypothetical protein